MNWLLLALCLLGARLSAESGEGCRAPTRIDPTRIDPAKKEMNVDEVLTTFEDAVAGADGN